MPVTSSSFSLEGAQKDGSRWCREIHLVSVGNPVQFYYLTPPGFDPTPVMQARVAVVNVQLADQEASDNIDRDGALTTNHQTAAQFATSFRERFRTATKSDLCYLAWWLLRRIAAGNVTDAQCQTAFGLTASAWTTFKTSNVKPRSDAWAVVIVAVGA